jgi:hypothetical protein
VTGSRRAMKPTRRKPAASPGTHAADVKNKVTIPVSRASGSRAKF